MSHTYRYVATAALAVVLAAGAAACGSDSEPQLRSEGAVEAGVAEVYGSDRQLQVQAAQAETAAREALIAEAAGSDRHLEILAAELEAEAAREALIEDAAGSDRHLENLAAELEDDAAPAVVTIRRW